MTTTWTPDDSAALTVALVAEDGHRIRLRGKVRAAAIQAMVDRGLAADTIAERLHLTNDALQQAARRAGVNLPRPEQDWWLSYAYPSRQRGHRHTPTSGAKA